MAAISAALSMRYAVFMLLLLMVFSAMGSAPTNLRNLLLPSVFCLSLSLCRSASFRYFYIEKEESIVFIDRFLAWSQV